MKIKRLALSAAKRRKKEQFKTELKALRSNVFVNNVAITQEMLAEYRLAKLKLTRLWYPKYTEE